MGSYDSTKGIIKNSGKKDFLKHELNEVDKTKESNPHVKFFIEKNENYIEGDELVSIASIKKSNLKKIAFRIISSATVEWVK
jgi:hypothetical protein